MLKRKTNILTRLLKYLLPGLALLLFHPLFGQQNKIDSLLTLLKKDKEDTSKINHLNALGWELMYSNPDTAIILSNEALQLAQHIIPPLGGKWGASSFGQLGAYNYLKGDYPKALDYYFRALKMDEELGNSPDEAIAQSGKSGIAKHLGNIGVVYEEQGDYPKALGYYFRALKIYEELGNKNGIAANLGNIGIVYMYQADYPKALNYFFRALKMEEELGSKNRIATNLGNTGNVYYYQGDYPKALDYYFRALKMAEELGNKNGIAIHLGNIGELYAKTGKFIEAEKYLKDALTISTEIEALDLVKYHQQNLSQLYDTTGRHQLAFEHYKKHIAARDSIANKENTKKQTRLEMNYEFEKKEAATKAEQDKKDAVTKIIIYSVSGGFLLVLLLAGFIFRSYRQKKKANTIIEQKKAEVEKKNQIIEEKNKNITESINYAKRIQQAKLPDKNEIKRALPDSFVLFKPKDIVSGDFYYFHKNEKTVFIASADCTGHGVPGAFMSMIGSEKLNDALAHSADTSEILRYLNKGIKASLRQTDSDESTRDGMDIALCSVDTANHVVKYAGANRPLWIIRKAPLPNEEGLGVKLEEIKGTKKAIGGFTDDSQHFDTHEIKLQKGDTFYIFSDGYADTFGGQGQKKVTTKKFKEILLSIQDKSLEEQEQHLDNFIEEWKGDTEQIDDILVIGVRL